MLNYQEFFELYKGQQNVGTTPENTGECVGLVQKWFQNFNIPMVWGHAKDLFYNAPDQYFEKILNTIEAIPQVGDIICWDEKMGGGFGHVGMASKTGAQLSAEVFQQNDPTGTPPQLKTYKYTNIIGWLRVKNVNATPQPPSEFIVGNDVSEHQGDIDWETYKNNTNFVIIRSTYGTGKTDLKYVRNKEEARRLNIPHGFYHYAYPKLNTPEAEADWCLMQISDIREEESIYLDFEEAYDGDKVDWCKRFLDRIAQKRDGYKALIYLNQSLCKNNNWTPVVNAGYKLWIASYTYSPLINSYEIGAWQVATLQQWTNQQTVPGCANPIDGDVFFGNVQGFRALGYKKPVVVIPLPVDECPLKLAQKEKELEDTKNQCALDVKVINDQKDSLSLQLIECQKMSTIYKAEYDKANEPIGYKVQIIELERQKKGFQEEITKKDTAYSKLKTKYDNLRKSGLKFIQDAVIKICEKLGVDLT